MIKLAKWLTKLFGKRGDETTCSDTTAYGTPAEPRVTGTSLQNLVNNVCDAVVDQANDETHEGPLTVHVAMRGLGFNMFELLVPLCEALIVHGFTVAASFETTEEGMIVYFNEVNNAD